MVSHGAHCDADLRRDGCVCTEDDVLTLAEQAERIAQLAAEWADRVAKAQVAETDRLAAEAFA